MFLPPPQSRADNEPPTAAYVQIVAASDVLSNRRVFRAPPLEVQPPLADVAKWLVSQRTLPFEPGD
jgi:hypothetical protein